VRRLHLLGGNQFEYRDPEHEILQTGKGALSDMLSKGTGKARAETNEAPMARAARRELRFFMMARIKTGASS
jgi:hypothetical protein